MTAATRITLSREALEALLAQLRSRLTEDEYATIRAIVETFTHVMQLLEQRATTIRRLRQLVFGARTEKTRDVLRRGGAPPAPPAPGAQTCPADSPRGHGRHGAAAYVGAQTVTVSHASLQHGDRCPTCDHGKVYALPPTTIVCLVGQAPLAATRWAIEKLRCHLCDTIFTATTPPGTALVKYDPTAGSMIAVLKYGTGLPFARLARLHASLGIPLPASTQWGVVAALATLIHPALHELIRHAAQGEVIHNDDTPMTVLALRAKPEDPAPAPAARTGVFTSGIVSTRDGHRVALFFTGHRHAGENLAAVLAQRAADLQAPIQMCDALARNVPKLPPGLATIVANCLAHARRQFVEIAPQFPDECRQVLEILAQVYRIDGQARTQHLAPDDRLRLHQTHSRPLMETLHAWLHAQVDEHRVEPNSGLGKAIQYFLNHWPKLARFLEVAGAPLDNNCERALKRAILHRKNALFYKTTNGAQVGDLFMTLIHTCELNGADPFHYFTALQHHAAALASSPAAWLPWTYRATLQQLDAAAAA